MNKDSKFTFSPSQQCVWFLQQQSLTICVWQINKYNSKNLCCCGDSLISISQRKISRSLHCDFNLITHVFQQQLFLSMQHAFIETYLIKNHGKRWIDTSVVKRTGSSSRGLQFGFNIHMATTSVLNSSYKASEFIFWPQCALHESTQIHEGKIIIYMK